MNPFAGPVRCHHVATVPDLGTALAIGPSFTAAASRRRVATVIDFGVPAGVLNPVGNAPVRVAPRSEVYHRHSGCRRLKGDSKVCRLVEVKGTHRACKACRPVE